MARPKPFNTRGIFGIETVGNPNVTTTAVTLNFEQHPFVNAPYNGLLIVKVSEAIPSGTTGTLPIVFQTGSTTHPATKAGGVPLTAADITGTGYYLFFYDRVSHVLQALSSVV